MRPSEHGSGVGVGEGVPDGSVTGVGLPNLLSFSVCELTRGDVLAGRFQIEAIIGNGGSGRVLRAFDRESRMLVALKILRQELAGEAVWAERFSRELRVGRAISHPNVCRVFDIGDAEGHKFLSLELATRGSLRNDVPKNDGRPGLPLPSRAWPARVEDARAIVNGVCALHTAGIVHRDLKPENILRMEDGRLVVTDFGLATDPGSGPGTTIMVGTPSYMAPEVVMGDPATARSDVWGLGVVLHEVFFGVRPRWKVVGRGYRRYVRPEGIKTDGECAVADLCGRCADDAPELRPASAIEVLRELNRALLGKKVVARHVRRRMAWTATAVATVAALVLVKARFTNQAEASSAQVAAAVAGQVLQPTGTPADWSKGATKLASFDGRLHCYALINGGTKVRAIWGTPRRAEDIDVKTGARTPSDLLPETYQDGCPALSADGKALLFEKASDTGTHIFLSASTRGANAKQVIRGSVPTWLPNGQEFVFALDTRHAAMFSVPTAEMTLVTDEDAGPRLLVDQAIDRSGTRLALLYTTETVDNLLVVHALPGLEVVGRIRLRASTRRLQFGERGDVLLSADGPHGVAELVTADLERSLLRTLGQFPDWDVNAVLKTADRPLIVFRQVRNDLWTNGPKGRTALTLDGASLHGSLSPTGQLLIQRRLKTGDFVIVRRGADGFEQQMTQGPLDATPVFLPDGKSWIYAKVDSRELVACSSAGNNCAAIHADPLVPAFPSVDPSGHQVAYLTLMNTARVRVVSRTGGPVRDLGPASDKCAPVWLASNRLWIAQPAMGSEMIWAELDSDTGARTGALQSVAIPRGQDCAIPIGLVRPRESEPREHIVSVLQETSEIACLATTGNL